MTKVSDRLNRLAESATLAMARMSRELQEQGHDVIALSLGEPDFDTPDFIKQAAKKAIDDNFSHYTPVPGLPELRNAIVKKFKRDNIRLEFTFTDTFYHFFNLVDKAIFMVLNVYCLTFTNYIGMVMSMNSKA